VTTDPFSGNTDAILKRRPTDPLMIEVNTSTEYWQKGASLDRRSVHIRLTEKGQSLREGLVGVHKRYVSMLPDAALNADALQTAEVTLRGLQRFWSRTGMILAQRSPLAA
jgi:hypothetical protein